jgi:hypothetical protein
MFGFHFCVEKEKLYICFLNQKLIIKIVKHQIKNYNSELLINPTEIQEFKTDNICDYIMTTNNANAAKLHDKSRKYLYAETSLYLSGNDELVFP